MNRRDLLKLIPVGFIPFLKKKKSKIKLRHIKESQFQDITGVSVVSENGKPVHINIEFCTPFPLKKTSLPKIMVEFDDYGGCPPTFTYTESK